jgi:hypothetical protein
MMGEYMLGKKEIKEVNKMKREKNHMVEIIKH